MKLINLQVTENAFRAQIGRQNIHTVFIDDNKNLLSNSFKGTAHQDGSG
jgi:hypothetical protein